MAEQKLLELLLVFAMGFAPLVTGRFFLPTSRLYSAAHIGALATATLGLALDLPRLCFGWLVFCVFGFLLFVRTRFAYLRSLRELAKGVPFVFSIIGATWLVAGTNDYHLLGYGRAFSFYAALHSHVLGWMVVGCIAHLAQGHGPFKHFYLASVFICLVSFLLIALGIDGRPSLKPLGVMGFTLVLPAAQLLVIKSTIRNAKPAALFGLLSFLGLVFTMTLAWQNELGIPTAMRVLNNRAMVSLHGLVNGLVVAPSFFLAAYFASRSEDGGGPSARALPTDSTSATP